MEFKKFLIEKLTLFFMLSTMITAAVYLIGSAYDRDALFGYDALLSPMRYAALCILPTFVTWSRRELSMRELLFRKALMLVLVEGVILYMAFTSPVIDTGRMQVVLTLMGSVLVIFLLVNLFLWLRDLAEAGRMNQDLENFRRLHDEESRE
ncbi:MAG: hypothetical protein IKI23_06580 [Lachnospiraceae bacterium]|nr:hypothetical protein [Lachnospiraceae bacterium]